MTQPPQLVGRELDLAVLLAQLKRIERGAPAALLVRGEAGIGKSRLVAELAARARQLGYPVVVGRADDLDRGIPYAVFRDLIARLTTGPQRGRVTALADEFRRRLDGDAPPPDTAPPDTAPPDTAGSSAGTAAPVEDNGDLSLVFASGVALFRELAARGPAVLVVEDVHIADRESLTLIALLARLADVPMLTVVSLRPDFATSRDVERLLERMAFDGRGATVDLDPLDRHETQALVAAVLSAAPDDRLTGAVFAASHGNPFFAREVVQVLTEDGAIVVNSGRARLQVDAGAAIGLRPSSGVLRRLVGGDAGDVDLARVMAVFGRFPLRHLALVGRLSGHSSDEVARSFDRLVKAGLVAQTADGGYEFTHSIVRNTLYEDIGPAERRRLHAAIATELATDRRAGFVLDVAQLATHVAESAEPGDTAAAEVLLDAGRAVSATAPLVAAEHHRRALELLPAGSPLRADALARQARSLHIGCRAAEAAAVGRQALTLLDRGEVRRATAAIVVGDLFTCGDVDEALRVVDAELGRGGETCPLLALKTHLLFQSGRPAEAEALWPDALATARADVPASTRLTALTQLIQYANHRGHVDAAADLLDQFASLEGQGSRTVQLTLHEWVGQLDWRPGLVGRLERHLASAGRLRLDNAALSMAGGLETDLVVLHSLRGEWDEALDVVRSAGFDLRERQAVTGAQLVLASGCEILVDRGAVDEAAELAGLLVTSFQAMRRSAALVNARLRHAVGDNQGALTLLAAERESGGPWRLGLILREQVEILLEEGRHGEAADAAAELDALAARTGWPESALPALRARALVDRDVDAARAYLAYAERESYEVERAHALLILGELDDDPGRNLASAYKLFDTFGAAPLRRRAAAGLRARGRAVPRRPAQPSSALTDTDLQLIRLVRDGLSNQQIATAMHFSPKTIEVYLSRVYVKTGCASRLALIRAVDTGAIHIS